MVKAVTGLESISVTAHEISNRNGDWPELRISGDYDFSTGDNKEITAILKMMMDDGVPMLQFFIQNARQNYTWESYFKNMPHQRTGLGVVLAFDEQTKEAINKMAEGLDIQIENVGNM